MLAFLSFVLTVVLSSLRDLPVWGRVIAAISFLVIVSTFVVVRVIISADAIKVRLGLLGWPTLTYGLDYPVG